LLTNAPVYATAIIDSLKIIGADATGLRDSLSPSSIVDIGFDLFYRSISNSAFWSPSDSLIAFFMGMIVLVTLTLVAAQMVMLLVAGWILAYGGIFCLGVGGSRWTSDMAVNYYKAVLGVAASLFVMILLVGIGKTFLVACSTSLSAGFNFKEMGVMVVVCVALLVLVNRVPRLVAGIITDTDVGSIGSVGRYAGGMASVAFSGRASGISKRSPSGALMQEASVMTRAVSGGQSMAATSSSAFLHKSDDDAVSFGGSGVSSLAAAMGNNTSSGASLVLDKKAASS
jgi:type IV secretion system protein TrbL